MAETLKVLLRTSVSGTDFVYGAGSEVDLHHAFALALVRAGYATPVGWSIDDSTVPNSGENTENPDAAESQAVPRRRGRPVERRNDD